MMNFEKYWTTDFPGVSPIGSSLRHDLPSRWIRFHSLPDAKRYVDTEDEYATLLHRANSLATHVLGQNSNCWLVASVPLEGLNKDEKKHWAKTKKAHDFSNNFQWLTTQDTGEESRIWTVFSKPVIWKENAFDEEFRAIADDLFPRLFWVSASTASIFAPYDGGFDLIASNDSQAEQLREKFPDWLPVHPAGL